MDSLQKTDLPRKHGRRVLAVIVRKEEQEGKARNFQKQRLLGDQKAVRTEPGQDKDEVTGYGAAELVAGAVPQYGGERGGRDL